MALSRKSIAKIVLRQKKMKNQIRRLRSVKDS